MAAQKPVRPRPRRRRHAGADEQLRHDLDEIAAATERAASLTAKVLAFNRKEVVQPTTLDVNAVIADLDGLLRRLLGESVELATVLEGPAAVRVDRTQLEQVIVNRP